MDARELDHYYDLAKGALTARFDGPQRATAFWDSRPSSLMWLWYTCEKALAQHKPVYEVVCLWWDTFVSHIEPVKHEATPIEIAREARAKAWRSARLHRQKVSA